MLKCKKINIPVINSKIKIKKSSSDSTKKKHCEKKQCEKKKCEDIVYKDELEENELCDGIYNLLENINNTQLPRLGTLNDYVDIIKDVNEYNELNDKQKLLIDNEIKEIEEYSKNLQVFGEIYKQVGDQLKLNKNDYRESFYKLKKSLGNITNTMNNFNLLQNKIKTINKNKINQLEKQNKLNKVILGLSNLKKLIYNCIN
jgi:hypothetical protein